MEELLSGKPQSDRMPVLFVGHGNPMNAIETNDWTRGWQDAVRGIETPKAILVISAHWLTPGKTQVTAMDAPRTIHDFGGFPDELFAQQYPAPGSPEMAEATIELVRKAHVEPDLEWGLDHGAWSVLLPMFPDADIPVYQLSIDYAASPETLFELAKDLRPLRDRGVLVIGSGNLVHNLRQMRMSGAPYDWAVEFETKMAEAIESGDPKPLVEVQKLGRIAQLAHPTYDHFLPVLYSLALRDPGEEATLFNRGIDLASVSMLSFRLG
ncbi:MAG: 4,5-DOPA dioxygenase extradiol [Candidatus Eisenbacteria bacterium]|nr:4,5-DOPA dioxygenase extradiol [Candidatus Eisenbacteria bacterium]